MNNQIDELFQRARESEPELANNGFMAGLGAKLNVAPVSAEPKFEWLPVLAAALAMLVVLLSTPILGWISIVPTILTNASFLIAAGMASFTFIACAASAYLFVEWESV